MEVNESEMSLTYTMDPEDIVYGLGENVRGINKRGWIYESKCSDESKHLEDRRSLYAAHNFIVVDGREKFGLFIDYPGILTFDVGYTELSTLKITASDWNLDVYVIEEDTVTDIIRSFRRLIGRSYIAPLWAFGNGQSRWGYINAEDVREVVRKHRENGIPLDMVYLDTTTWSASRISQSTKSAFPTSRIS
jgi:alpha-glucosidase